MPYSKRCVRKKNIAYGKEVWKNCDEGRSTLLQTFFKPEEAMLYCNLGLTQLSKECEGYGVSSIEEKANQIKVWFRGKNEIKCRSYLVELAASEDKRQIEQWMIVSIRHYKLQAAFVLLV